MAIRVFSVSLTLIYSLAVYAPQKCLVFLPAIKQKPKEINSFRANEPKPHGIYYTLNYLGFQTASPNFRLSKGFFHSHFALANHVFLL